MICGHGRAYSIRSRIRTAVAYVRAATTTETVRVGGPWPSHLRLFSRVVTLRLGNCRTCRALGQNRQHLAASPPCDLRASGNKTNLTQPELRTSERVVSGLQASLAPFVAMQRRRLEYVQDLALAPWRRRHREIVKANQYATPNRSSFACTLSFTQHTSTQDEKSFELDPGRADPSTRFGAAWPRLVIGGATSLCADVWHE